MKNKSEVDPLIEKFVLMIKNQFDVCIKTLRSDNALEFCTRRLAEFYGIHGIIHQTSCPHTSQQNGVAERKHRHILDMTRALLIHNSVP